MVHERCGTLQLHHNKSERFPTSVNLIKADVELRVTRCFVSTIRKYLTFSPIRLYTAWCAGSDHDMPVSSVLCHLCRLLVSGHIVSHQVSPSQPTIPLSVYHHLQDLSRGIIFISPSNMPIPYQHLLSEEFCHRVHACLFPDVFVSDMV